RNLTPVVLDNESLLSVSTARGDFPTATSTGSDLARIAAAAGVPRTITVSAIDALVQGLDTAIAARALAPLAAGESLSVSEILANLGARDVHSAGAARRRAA